MKIFIGKVISTKMSKTAVVEVVRMISHPTYKKKIKTTKKYHVHDDKGASVGETVQFIACKPKSKTKHWKIIEAKEKSKK